MPDTVPVVSTCSCFQGVHIKPQHKASSALHVHLHPCTEPNRPRFTVDYGIFGKATSLPIFHRELGKEPENRGHLLLIMFIHHKAFS